MIDIVEFSYQYVDKVAELEAECFSEPFSKSLLISSIENNTISSYVALCNNEVVGFIEWQNICDLYININTLETKNTFRKKGIASALVNKLISLNPNTEITLEVRESNTPAKSLYKKYNFVEIGLRKNYYRSPIENALILQRKGEVS